MDFTADNFNDLFQLLIELFGERRIFIQVAGNIDQPHPYDREFRGLFQAMTALNLSQGVLLSKVNGATVGDGGKEIKVRAVAEWLLE